MICHFYCRGMSSEILAGLRGLEEQIAEKILLNRLEIPKEDTVPPKFFAHVVNVGSGEPFCYVLLDGITVRRSWILVATSLDILAYLTKQLLYRLLQKRDECRLLVEMLFDHTATLDGEKRVSAGPCVFRGKREDYLEGVVIASAADGR